MSVIGDYGDAFKGISDGNEPLRKAIGAILVQYSDKFMHGIAL